ncbi:MAG: hypothetical protein E4H18_04515, partial [Hyphomicrobiales bacterium]
WMSGLALTAARWLGYVGFDRIIDNRNETPVVRIPANFRIAISVDAEIELPSPEDFEPSVWVFPAGSGDLDFHWRAQPYTLIFAGEKASLAAVIDPVARDVNAMIFLPTGEMSDGMIWTMVKAIENAARPAVIFYLADFDPAGFSMPKNLARKLQAMRTLGHLTQPVTAHATALTLEQCVEFGLPSTPIKATDRRAAAWTAATGREQTEIDALAALNPRALQKILRDAVEPYFDVTLSGGPGPLLAAEGVETALALLTGLQDRQPRIWASLSTSGMAALILPPDPGELVLAPDGDQPGRDAAKKLAQRAIRAGWRVRVMAIQDGRDWNDAAQEVAV